MYIPVANRVEDRRKINALIHAYGFATLITSQSGALCAIHLPVLLEESANGWGTLRSHMARANEQWRELVSGQETLCIFSGPHSYISPSWYVMQHTVPTWNYATVHVYGIPTIVDNAALKKIIFDTTEKYESSMPKPWRIPLSAREVDAMLKAIVGFTIEITRVEAKFKLGQNRSEEDQESMLKALEQSTDSSSRDLAEFIRDHID
jgi:transcriptional regulator